MELAIGQGFLKGDHSRIDCILFISAPESNDEDILPMNTFCGTAVNLSPFWITMNETLSFLLSLIFASRGRAVCIYEKGTLHYRSI